MARIQNPITRFWSNIDMKSQRECWLWKRGVESGGYGVFGRPQQRAHRFAYELEHGPIPLGMCVCHRCDTPRCCNPEHLFLGTTHDNNTDRARKGRNGTSAFTGFSTNPPRGSLNIHARLTDADVLRIRELWSTHQRTQVSLAVEYGIHKGTIWRAITGGGWKHLHSTITYTTADVDGDLR